jgi:hypothetical protein
MRRGRRDEPAKIDGAIQCFGRRLVEKRPAADSSSWRLPGQGRRPSMRCALSMRARHSAESMVRTAWSRARERKSTRQKISPFGGEKSEKKIYLSASELHLAPHVCSHRPSHALYCCCRCPPLVSLFSDGFHEEGSFRVRGCQGQGPALHIGEEDDRQEIGRGQIERRRRCSDFFEEGPRRRREISFAGQAGDGRGHFC